MVEKGFVVRTMWLKLALTSALVLAWPLQAKTPSFFTSPAVLAVAELPPQGRDMLQRIHQGGPFRSEKDGVVFANRERLLPVQPRAYYLEYTVKTPHSRNRGIRRIVCGGPATTPDVCYYTADHYASFRRIVP